MKTNKKRKYIIWGAVIVLLMAIGATAAFAQGGFPGSGSNTPFQGQTPDHFNGSRPDKTPDNELLAEALGITVEELQTAFDTAGAAALEQAVADGLITQEQADEIASGSGRGLHNFMPRAAQENAIDFEALLADALGISVDDLQAARETVAEARLAEMVESGRITQEQADMMRARQAVNEYVDHDAIQAMIQEAYETAVQQALDNGDITQEQADQLLSGEHTFGPGGFGGQHGHGRPGGFGGRGNNGPQGQFAPPQPPAGANG